MTNLQRAQPRRILRQPNHDSDMVFLGERDLNPEH